MMRKPICLLIFLNFFVTLMAQQDSLRTKADLVTSSVDSFKIVGKAISGTAGTYSAKADGSKTASGAIFHNSEFTAACNKFRLNTWIRVTNLKNKKSVIVKINDRTSKKESAPIVQLSRASASVLGILKSGTVKIKVEQIILTDSFLLVKIDSIAKEPEVKPLVDTTTTPNTFKATGKVVKGIASFYSANLDGTLTATGERYRNSKYTGASNNLKLNTWVLVTNLKNQKAVIVRINDRMHPRMKRKGRVIDLSGIAAKTLDFIEDGLTKVKLEVIEFVREDLNVKPPTDTLPVKTDSIAPVDSVKIDLVKIDSVKTDENTVIGIASYYSYNLDGTKTATGEIYRNTKMSAASNNFNLNSWVRVTNLKNNKSIILRINDHMHPRMKEKGRVVDLSRIAAKKLNFLKSGLTKVKVELVEKGTLN